jgi:anti-sigma factor RsiW
MMQRPSDEVLVAYLDGELDEKRSKDIEAWLEHDPVARDRVAALVESAGLVRAAFDETLREPVPERLLAAARGGEAVIATPSESGAIVLPFRRKNGTGFAVPRRWLIGVPVAASLFGLLIGTGVGYFGGQPVIKPQPPTRVAENAGGQTATQNWLDNIAGYYKLFVSANGDQPFVDFRAEGDGKQVVDKISARGATGVRVPDLKPWGLTFQGARMIIVEGRPAAQLFYTTDNKALGAITVVVGQSKRQDVPPTFERRQDVNVMYWRNRGRAYAIVGEADVGYLWNLANDIAWQFDAI